MTDSTTDPEAIRATWDEDADPRPRCGHLTRHGQSVGCCAVCSELFSSDSAFAKHMPVTGECVPPETVGLVGRPSRMFPDETIWGRPGGDTSWRDVR